MWGGGWSVVRYHAESVQGVEGGSAAWPLFPDKPRSFHTSALASSLDGTMGERERRRRKAYAPCCHAGRGWLPYKTYITPRPEIRTERSPERNFHVTRRAEDTRPSMKHPRTPRTRRRPSRARLHAGRGPRTARGSGDNMSGPADRAGGIPCRLYKTGLVPKKSRVVLSARGCSQQPHAGGQGAPRLSGSCQLSRERPSSSGFLGPRERGMYCYTPPPPPPN